MRIQEMFYLVSNALKNWVSPDFIENRKNGELQSYSCTNAEQIVSVLDTLRPFPAISEQIDIIYDTHDSFYKGKPGPLTRQDYSDIRTAMAKIHTNLEAMDSMCRSLGLEHNSYGFDVKLPPDMTLAELSECTKDLDNLFSRCVLFKNDEEQVKLRGVDVGSVWLTFSIIGAGAVIASFVLHNLAAFVDEIIVIREHMAVLKQQEEAARRAKLKNDVLETIVDANREIAKAISRESAEKLAAKNEIESNDGIENIRGFLDIIGKWTDKGMEIHAAVESPEEIKSAFPPVERQSLPSTIRGVLTSGTEKQENNDE